jgi:hypothetical protein
VHRGGNLMGIDEMQNRWSRVRCANIALALVVAILLQYHRGWIYREGLFQLTGRASVDGLTIYLDPTDEVITRATLAHGEWEIGESAEIRRLIRPGDTVVDVGANVGWYTLLASSRFGDSGRVIAFEPERSLSLLRKSTLKDSRSTLLGPCARGSGRGALSSKRARHVSPLIQPSRVGGSMGQLSLHGLPAESRTIGGTNGFSHG